MTEKKNSFLFGYLRLSWHDLSRPAANMPIRSFALRQLIAIVLLLLLLLQLAGYFFIFAVQRYEIQYALKQQIKAGVPEAELMLLKIPRSLEEKPNPIFQRLHDREFRYSGAMYDIVRRETHGDTTWYYCLSDEKETRLFANLDEFVKREVSQHAKQKARLAKLLNFFGGGFVPAANKFFFASAAEEMVASNYFFKLKTWIGSPLTPPPEA